MRSLIKWASAAVLLGTLMPTVASASTAPAPVLHNDNMAAKAGDWYTGAIPPNVNYSKPVVLFVQGLHSDYTTWTTGDDFYDAAYNQGYRTAFVQLQDADGTGGSMWTNGQILAGVIKKVANYYGVKQINIVAHSKGGIDTQTALVYYGAYPYVNVVQQLSTPNLGSELADMSYGTWTWWLGALMGQQDDAVYTLQTSYMKTFRSDTDPSALNKYARTYMADGTGDDGWFSATWYAHSVLPGKDDGAVADYSALGLPNGVFDFTDDGSQTLSHSMMHAASKTWWEVAPKLTTYNYYTANTAAVKTSAATVTTASTMMAPMTTNAAIATAASLSTSPLLLEGSTPPVETSNAIMRGGPVNGTATDSFTLESGLHNATFDIMTRSNATQVKLISPSGKIYAVTKGVSNPDNSVLFANASHNFIVVPKPEKGTWHVQVSGQNDAYFLYGALDGGAVANVQGDKKVHNLHDPYVQLDFNLSGGKAGSGKINAHLSKANHSGRSTMLQDVQMQANGSGGLTTTFVTPSEPGVYNVSFDVTGVNAKGETFTRSVNYNFAVTDENGQLPQNGN